MIKEELFKYRKIIAEIEQVKRELESVEPEYSKDSVTGSDKYFPYTKHNFKIEGYDYNSYKRKVQRIRNRLSHKLTELVDEKDRLTEFIYRQEDSELRQILTYRYIDGLQWKEIGEKMNYASITVRAKHDRFLKCIN